jgi:hypothetical protein
MAVSGWSNGVRGCRSEDIVIKCYDKDDTLFLTRTINASVTSRLIKQSFKSRIWNTTLGKYATRHRNIKNKYNITINAGVLGTSALTDIKEFAQASYFDITFGTSNQNLNGIYVMLNEQIEFPDPLSSGFEKRTIPLRFEGATNVYEENI